MNIIEKLILKNKKYKNRVDKEINRIKVIFDSYEHEEDILDFLDNMENKMMHKYSCKVGIFENLIDKMKISYINYYLDTYIEMDKNKYYYKIKDIEYYIFKK